VTRYGVNGGRIDLAMMFFGVITTVGTLAQMRFDTPHQVGRQIAGLILGKVRTHIVASKRTARSDMRSHVATCDHRRHEHHGDGHHDLTQHAAAVRGL